jgi:hypothetical protein
MVATFEKLVKTDGKAPDDLEKQVATSITELSQNNTEIKSQLNELYFVGAQVKIHLHKFQLKLFI